MKRFVALGKKKIILSLVEAKLHNIVISYSGKGNFIFPIAPLINQIFKVASLCSQFQPSAVKQSHKQQHKQMLRTGISVPWSGISFLTCSPRLLKSLLTQRNRVRGKRQFYFWIQLWKAAKYWSESTKSSSTGIQQRFTLLTGQPARSMPLPKAATSPWRKSLGCQRVMMTNCWKTTKCVFLFHSMIWNSEWMHFWKTSCWSVGILRRSGEKEQEPTSSSLLLYTIEKPC